MTVCALIVLLTIFCIIISSMASFELNRQMSSSSSSSLSSNGGVHDMFRIAARRAKESTYSISMDIQERYIS